MAPPPLLLLQLVINGIALGAAYALVALGFVLILNATSAVNFTQGDMVTALFGLLFSLVAYFPLMNRPPVAVFISTIAVGIMLQNGSNALFGGEPRAVPPLIGTGGRVEIADGLTVSTQSLGIVAAAAVL